MYLTQNQQKLVFISECTDKSCLNPIKMTDSEKIIEIKGSDNDPTFNSNDHHPILYGKSHQNDHSFKQSLHNEYIDQEVSHLKAVILSLSPQRLSRWLHTGSSCIHFIYHRSYNIMDVINIFLCYFI